MHKILLADAPLPITDATTYLVDFQQANAILPILRSEHFKEIALSRAINDKERMFLSQIARLLRKDGVVLLKGEDIVVEKLLTALGLKQLGANPEGFLQYGKAQAETKQNPKKEELHIGFKTSAAEEVIDEEELLKNEGIKIVTKKAQKCEDKPRACANCKCGRKDQKVQLSKEQLVESINDGKPVSGCGKCELGDSFRCGTCPYKGLPAFKIGDRLRMGEEGKVEVMESSVMVNAGRVWVQL